MRNNLNLNWLRSFEAAARLLSFTAASHEIGLTQTAVSQHIKALEAQLGDTLFIRRAKSLQLTDVGKAYLATVTEALNAIEMSTTGLFGPRQSRTITLRASMAVIMWIAPRLDGFLDKNPDTGVKLITSIWKNESPQQPVDVEIILASKNLARVDLQHLSDESLVPILSAQSHGEIKSASDLQGKPSIHIMGFDDHWARYLAAFSAKPTSSRGQIITDTSTAAIEMVAAGLGCAIIIERFARQSIERGHNIRIAGSPVALGQSYYLARPTPDVAPLPHVQTFNTWLRAQFRNEVPQCDQHHPIR